MVSKYSKVYTFGGMLVFLSIINMTAIILFTSLILYFKVMKKVYILPILKSHDHGALACEFKRSEN